MHPADQDTSIGKRVTGGAQARNINIGKRAAIRPTVRFTSARARNGGGGIVFLMALTN